jgi:hypothetical protein
MTLAPRRTLVDRMRSRLQAGHWPRVHCMLIVTLATAAAFLTSFLLLAVNLQSMAVRYGAAALAGYATFLILLHAWVRWKWSRVRFNGDGEVFDVASHLIDVPVHVVDSAARVGGGGGRSGGGGSSGGWGSGDKASVSGGGGKGGAGWNLDFDADDLFWVIVAVVAAFAGIAAIGYVIWIAPTLLAELIVNGAIAGKVYHGMRKHEDSFWTSHIFRHTIVSGVVVVVCAILVGYAFNRIAPEARSIGGVWAHLQQK